ncbi:MAG: hypothetical protein ACXWTN_09925 [Methylosarcina sp.]
MNRTRAIKNPLQRLITRSLILYFAAFGHAWPSGEQAAFEVSLQRFREALKQHDAEALSDLTQLPFLYQNRPRNRTDFIKEVVPDLFGAKVSACLAKARPYREEERFVLYCSPYAFYFGHGLSVDYRLIEFGVDGEDVP